MKKILFLYMFFAYSAWGLAQTERVQMSDTLQEITVTSRSAQKRVQETQIGVEKIDVATLAKVPALFGEIGVWLAFPVAEFISFMLASTLVYYNRDNYGYGKSGVALKMQGDYLLKTTDLVEDDAD